MSYQLLDDEVNLTIKTIKLLQMKHTRILFSLTLFLLFVLNGQSQVQLNIPNETVSNGDQITLPVTVTNFDNLLVLQCALRFDTTMLDFAHFTSNTEVEYMDTTLVNYDADESAIRLAWQTGDFTNGTTEDDGSVLFEAVFDVIGEPCDSTFFTLHEFGFFMTQVVNVSGENLTLEVTDGLVKIPGEDCGPGPDDFTLDIGDVTTNQGQEICVPIIISGIDSVNGIQFSLSWDPTLLSYTGYQNSALPTAQFNETITDQGKWSVLWTAPDLTSGMTFPNGSAIIEVCFTAIGIPGSVAPITFTNTPTVQEFADVNGQVFPNLVAGSVTITGDPVDPVHVNIGSGNANPGSVWCVDITTANFVDMVALQGSFVFDSEVLEYSHFNQGLLPGVTGITLVQLPTEPNVVRFVWTDNAVQGVTLNDGDVLFQLCFNVVGDCDETTNIEFLGEPVEIVSSNVDNVVVPVETSSGTFTVNCTPTIILTPFDQSCSDVCDGYLVLEYSGLQSPVNINWSSADTMNLCAGQYSVTLTDANSVELSASANIGAPAPIVINGSSSGDFATGSGVIDITVNGGTPDYTYAWNTTPVQTTEDATGLTFGSYTVVVTDENGCEESFSDTIVEVIGDLEIDVDVTPKGQFDVSCFGECDGEATITADNAVLPLTILWDDGNTNMVRDDLCAGEYCLTVTDANSNSIDTCFTLEGPSALELEIDKDCSSGIADGSATSIVSGGAGNYTYLWNDVDQSTTAIIENLLPNTYIVVVTDGNGCQISGEVNLDCTPTDNCYEWREIITPNGDGLNENLIITCADETDNELSIYNRWGQLVYETVNYNNDWRGEDLDGNPVPNDTYMFVLQVKSTTETEIYKGVVSVFRKFN